MIRLYTEYNKPAELKEEMVPWFDYFNRMLVADSFDDSDVKIVKEVDDTELFGKNIRGKFGYKGLIGIDKISEGCKTVLCINHAVKNNTSDKLLFNITSCGRNAVECILRMKTDSKINVYCGHEAFGMTNDGCDVEVENKIYHTIYDAHEAFVEASELGV